MSFHSANPQIYHIYTPNPGVTPTRRKMLFRRVPTDPSLVPADFDPIVHTGYPLKTQRLNRRKIKPVSCVGLNRYVCGIMFLVKLLNNWAHNVNPAQINV